MYALAHLGVLAPGRIHDQDSALVPPAIQQRGQLVVRELLHVAVAVPEVPHSLMLRLLCCAGHHIAGVQPALLAGGILCTGKRFSSDESLHIPHSCQFCWHLQASWTPLLMQGLQEVHSDALCKLPGPPLVQPSGM